VVLAMSAMMFMAVSSVSLSKAKQCLAPHTGEASFFFLPQVEPVYTDSESQASDASGMMQ
jgi:hypothetical protein